MRITSVETFPVRVPLVPSHRMISALGRHEVSQYVLVRIETENGLEGAGEATVLPRWSGETVWGAKAIIDEVFAPALIGVDPEDIEKVDEILDQLSVGNWFAKSAIEMACWDVVGKSKVQPIFELLGGPKRSSEIRCRFSMGAYDPDRARNRTVELLRDGFTTIKVKVGTNLADDVERVRIVREVAGDEIDLVIDANGGFDVETAIEAARQLEDARVTLFEQPTPRGDFQGLAQVRRETGLKVMADDICFDLNDALECIRADACDVISIYPGKNGGIRKSQRIAELAAEYGVACSIGSNLELDVACAAMAQLVVGCENLQVESYPGDILGPIYHERRIVTDPLAIEGPIVRLNDSPGLGVNVDWELVRELWPSA
ncbi:mandelate racemase/muconate lactonizing enzyme family protein [Thalassoroseus pseudoceratinae]|uniref:mandelate racemase/muconate lactonizing enzyme family protein n=1 Tax=Thalassoroseus pseudoceratinae TaxID=2713176 RepID=UPI0014230806|nr:enolase C-terminal domain-like protein [Thalassoroseus pseudoceratinae]